jgi:putative restriction endonuclease
VPWSKSDSSEERIDTSNAILLCKLHDALFENGFISLTDDYKVIYSQEFNFERQGLTRNLNFRLPKVNKPNTKYLRAHRKSCKK